MALKSFLIFLLVLAYVDFLEASPTRRQYIGITEATASDTPVTNDGEVWDDNDEFDLDGEGWFSRSVVSPSSLPQTKFREMTSSDYDAEDDYSRVNAMAGFGDEDDDEDEDDGEEEDEHHEQQEAEEMDEDGDANDSEFLFSSPKDTRLVLEDDDDEQSGPIKVRHTGRNPYSHSPSENSVESSDEEDDEEHPDDFAIDEDDKGGDEDDEERDENSVEVLPRREPLEDDEGEDEFVSEGDENDDMFENPEEEAAQVIYGDHVFLY